MAKGTNGCWLMRTKRLAQSSIMLRRKSSERTAARSRAGSSLSLLEQGRRRPPKPSFIKNGIARKASIGYFKRGENHPNGNALILTLSMTIFLRKYVPQKQGPVGKPQVRQTKRGLMMRETGCWFSRMKRAAPTFTTLRIK